MGSSGGCSNSFWMGCGMWNGVRMGVMGHWSQCILYNDMSCLAVKVT